MFVSLLSVVNSVQHNLVTEKESAELKYLCNYFADSLILDADVEIYVPKETRFSYNEGYLICQRDKFVSVVPLPKNVEPEFNTEEIVGWLKI